MMQDPLALVRSIPAKQVCLCTLASVCFGVVSGYSVDIAIALTVHSENSIACILTASIAHF